MILCKQKLKTIITFIKNELEYYSILSKDDIEKCKNFIKNVCSDISLKDLIDIRNLYIYILSNSKGMVANKIGNNIITDFISNHDILLLANKYKLPPMVVLYQILIEQKYESHQIPNMLLNKKKLPNIIQSQLKDIHLHDPNKWFKFLYNNTFIDKIKKITSITFDIYDHKRFTIITFSNLVSYLNIKFNWLIIVKHIFFDIDIIRDYIKKEVYKYTKIGIGVILFSKIFITTKTKLFNNIKIFDYSFLP